MPMAAAASSSSAPEPSISPPKKQPPGPWSHTETVHLIDAYQEKWYSLKRGQLKARHWEEVANSVALRCGFDEPAKTSTQCRHKIEKLRKRYRTEKQRELACNGHGADALSRWVYFELMDLMEKGPQAHAPAQAISLRPARNPPPPLDRDSDTTDNDTDKNTRSLHRLLDQATGKLPTFPSAAAAAADNNNNTNNNKSPTYSSLYKRNDQDFRFGSCSARNPKIGNRVSGGEEQGFNPLSELASAVRSLGEGLLRMERMKMEMIKEMERERMEMEMKRTEMILDSQRYLADIFAKALYSNKKAKRLQSPEI